MPGRRSPPYSGPVSTRPDDEWSPDRVSRFGLLWRIAVAGLTGYLLWFSVVALFAEQQAPVTAATARLVMIDPLLGLVSLGIVARWRRTHPMATAIGVASTAGAFTTCPGSRTDLTPATGTLIERGSRPARPVGVQRGGRDIQPATAGAFREGHFVRRG